MPALKLSLRPLVALLATTLACSTLGCAAETDDEIVEESEDAIRGPRQARNLRAIEFVLPDGFPRENASRVFSTEDSVRDHFGSSAGERRIPYQGQLSFPFIRGERSFFFFVDRPDLPAGKELVISGVRRLGWDGLEVSTCTRRGKSRSYALAIVDVPRNAESPRDLDVITWYMPPDPDDGLKPCK